MKPKVSIIIPAYNAEKWISTALDSVVNQSLRDIEIIIVNDCSTDNTGKIISQYSDIDCRIKVINNTLNEGIFISRHRAFTHSAGTYIMFLDADDYLELDACEYLVHKMKTGNWDVYGFGSTPFGHERVNPELLKQIKANLTMSRISKSKNPDIVIQTFIYHHIPWCVWNKIYKREILEKVFEQHQDERLQMAEDFVLTTMVLCYTKSFSKTPKCFHHYRVGSGMSTNQEILRDNELSNFASFANAYVLLMKWIPNTGLGKNCSNQLIKYVSDKLISDLLEVWTKRVPIHLAKVFMSKLLEYVDLQTLTEWYVNWVFDKHSINSVEAGWIYANSLSQKKKNIKTVAMYYYRIFNGGLERVVSLLSQILLNAGYKVIIITDTGPSDEDYILPNNVLHICFKSIDNTSIGRMNEWRRIIKKYAIDAVIYHAWMDANLSLDCVSIKSMQVPIVGYSHGSLLCQLRFPQYNDSSWFEQSKIFSLFDIMTVLSEVDLRWSTALGLNAVQVINPLSYLPKDCISPTYMMKEAIWVGRLSGEKQFKDAFKIAEIVKSTIPEFKLHVIGRTESHEEFISISEELTAKKLDNCVILEGFHKDPSPYYQHGSILLVTSKFEGFSMTCQEAMCFGLPIVSYELPNVELLRMPDCGVSIVPQRDVESAADKIIELLNNPALLACEGKKARASIEKIYQSDLEEVWKDILKVKIFQKDKVSTNRNDCSSIAIRMAMQNAALFYNDIAISNTSSQVCGANSSIHVKKNVKWVMRKIIKYCIPNGILQLRMNSFQVACGSRLWLIKQTIKAILPYGVLRIRSIIRKNWQ